MADDRSSPELIKNWRLNWLESLHEFSDYSLQLYSWRGGLEPNNPHWSFVEFMCCYFDDCSLSGGYAWAVEDGFVSIEEETAVAEFHQAADQYKPPKNDSYDHGAILQDMEWQVVVELAVAACNRLSSLITDPTEAAILGRLRAGNRLKPDSNSRDA